MLKQTFTRIFPDPFAGMADEHRREFIRQTAFINFTRARVFSAILAALQLPLILVDFQNKAKGLWESTSGYHTLFLLHLVVGAAFLLYFLSAYAMRLRQPADISLRHRVMVLLFAALGLFLASQSWPGCCPFPCTAHASASSCRARSSSSSACR